MKKMILLVMVAGMLLLALNNPFQPSASGYYVPEPASDMMLFTITDHTFDPLVSQPDLPDDLYCDKYPGDGEGYYLVQLRGPIYAGMIDQLKNAGAAVLGCHSQNMFIVKMNDRIRSRISELSMVRWTGIYQPAFKLYESVLNGSQESRFLVYLFHTESINDARIALEALKVKVLDLSNTADIKFFFVSCRRSQIPGLARLPSVWWIEEWFPSAPENERAQWVNQKGLPPTDTTRSIWRQGIFGTDEILGYTDTGLDVNHWAFRDPAFSITDTGEFPTHQKVVVFKHYPPASGVGDPDGHGTHVGGTTAGNDSAMGGTFPYDGHSKKARISHLSPIPSSSYNYITILDMLTNTLRNPQLRTHTVSNSWWTGTMGQYSAKSMEFDMFCWKNKDVVLIKSCGNQGQTTQYRITEPGNAKSVIAVAALGNGTNATTLASYSSRGPAPDGRVKPDCSTIGGTSSDVYSAQNGTTNAYSGMMGTSMAAPSCNGCIGLIREYLRKGWYPSGTLIPSDSMGYVSGALLKAMIIVSCDPNVGAYVVPSEYIGWGRIDLDSVLYFALPTPEKRELLLDDDTTGLATGQYAEFQFMVDDSTVPLRAVVCWTDTAAAVGAARALINNLNVRMVNAYGDSFKGSVYAAGQSVINPTARYDSLNPYECFRINVPRTGLWQIRIMAANVVTSRQPFAVVLTGAFGTVPGIEESGSPVNAARLDFESFFPNPARIGSHRIRFSLPALDNAYALKVYSASGSLVAILWQGKAQRTGWQTITWDGRDGKGRRASPGVYFYRLVSVADGGSVTQKAVLVK